MIKNYTIILLNFVLNFIFLFTSSLIDNHYCFYNNPFIQQKYYKKNFVSLLKNLSKHSSLWNNEVYDGIHSILKCVHHLDPIIKEITLQILSSLIPRQSADFSRFIINSGKYLLNVNISM